MLKIFNKSSGKSSSLVSQDFAAVVERHRQVEAATTALVKTCKKCEEALQEMNKGRSKLRDEVLALPLFEPERHKRADNDTMVRRITMFKNATEGILELGRGLKTHLVGAVDEPMRKFLKIYPSVNDAVREHDRAAAEYEKARERYEKQQRSASSDSVKMEKLERQRDQAQKAWELVDTTLPEELPRLYEARVQFMEPTMLALLQAQIKFLSGLAATMETMFEADQVAKTDEEYAKEIEHHFASLTRLSITSHH